jgi:hypothetical protein
MTELAGFGIPDFLPLATREVLAAEEIREARDAEREREQRAEIKRSAALAMYKDQAEARGEHVSALALATGQVTGRSTAEIFAAATAMADMDDAREAARQRRADSERLNLCFPGMPVSRSEPKTPEDREVANILRHYQEIHGDTGVIDRAIIASEARKALQRDRPLIPPRTTARDRRPAASWCGTGWPA